MAFVVTVRTERHSRGWLRAKGIEKQAGYGERYVAKWVSSSWVQIPALNI